MIKIFNNRKLIITSTKAVREYTSFCPSCCKLIKWDETEVLLSPFNCPGCRDTLIDLSRLVEKQSFRMIYNLVGDKTIKCGASGLT